jgi:NAD(P)-dependent dehydrogenase (short-subunit alcohol dehydrogenase family)
MVAVNRVLVTGATGRVGREVVSQLQAGGAEVSALVRNPDTAKFSSEVEVVRGDLTVPESLEPHLDGIDAVFLVWTAPPATVAPVVARIAKHARRIVFLSAPLKTPHPFFQQPSPARALAERIELLIETSGLECSPQMRRAGGRRRFAPATPCAGRISLLLRPRSTSVTSLQSESARCARTGTLEQSTF